MLCVCLPRAFGWALGLACELIVRCYLERAHGHTFGMPSSHMQTEKIANLFIILNDQYCMTSLWCIRLSDENQPACEHVVLVCLFFVSHSVFSNGLVSD